MKPGIPHTGWLALAALALIATGCCTEKPIAYHVDVSLDDDSWNSGGAAALPSLEVDLVGINDNEKQVWESYPVSKYFSPGDDLRRDADRYTLTFTNDDRQSKRLSKKDLVWKNEWLGHRGKGAKWLFVLVNLPGIEGDKPGEEDPRRQILPLACKAWGDVDSLDLQIKRSIMLCKTPRAPEDDD